jgi:hypothetical protein
VRRFAAEQQVPLVDFVKGQRKDDVMHEHLARFAGTEGVLFIGRAQEKTRAHNRILRTGLAELTDPSPPASTLRAADRAYQAALDDLTQGAGLVA